MDRPIPRIGSVDAVLVQQNTDPWASGDDENAVPTCIRLARKAIAERPAQARYRRLQRNHPLAPLCRISLLLQPEAILDPLIPFIRDSGTWLLTGAPVVIDWKTYEATNSVILIDPRANLVESYAKVHPVPFAEAIPFMEYPWFKAFMQKTVGLEGGWAMGTRFVIFNLPTKDGTIRFGAPICFEDAFADVCRNFSLGGADLLINLTDISWSKTESAEIQHWAAARFRAIEREENPRPLHERRRFLRRRPLRQELRCPSPLHRRLRIRPSPHLSRRFANRLYTLGRLVCPCGTVTFRRLVDYTYSRRKESQEGREEVVA
jgi:apolipoprotein N-acyltransferase